ncbi:FkbM family methyltransferase [Gammaproteobacteria bacterium]|nr:FkbM family methyltransferase [Gammaproteobacteria bacterium]
MLPKEFKPKAFYDLIRLGKNNDGGYLVESKSIEKTKALISMGIGKNWRFEEDFIEHQDIVIHAYDHSVSGFFWPKFFIKRCLSVLIGRLNAPYHAVKKYIKFMDFFRNKAVLFFEKIGSEEEGYSNLKKTLERIKEKPVFLKIDIEGYEYQILNEIILNSELLSGMVIEFHKISDHIDEIKSFINNFELKLVHIHPNNNRVDDHGNPKAIEMSFARDPKKLSDRSVLPHPLDQLNVPRKKVVELKFMDS